jgi:hypothetical protein
MAEFNIRSESVDVEQIMNQIRARIREKRGVDYTEDQIRELANVRLEKFLDPKNLRSDLLEQFRRSRPAIAIEPQPVEPPYTFSDETLFASHRGPLRVLRQLLRPILKLFLNPNTLNQVLHAQAQFNVDTINREQRRRIEFERSRSEWNALYYEVLHNLVLETTRNGIELKNMKMRLEALASRLDFSERRVRALEGVVQYRPEAVRQRGRGDGAERDRRPTPRDADAAGELEDAGVTATPDAPRGGALASVATGDAVGRRRRRRRRGRRGAGPGTASATGTGAEDHVAGPNDEANGEPIQDADESFAESEGMPVPVSFDDRRPTDNALPDVPHADNMEAENDTGDGRLADLPGPEPEIPPDSDEQ